MASVLAALAMQAALPPTSYMSHQYYINTQARHLAPPPTRAWHVAGMVRQALAAAKADAAAAGLGAQHLPPHAAGGVGSDRAGAAGRASRGAGARGGEGGGMPGTDTHSWATLSYEVVGLQKQFTFLLRSPSATYAAPPSDPTCPPATAPSHTHLQVP